MEERESGGSVYGCGADWAATSGEFMASGIRDIGGDRANRYSVVKMMGHAMKWQLRLTLNRGSDQKRLFNINVSWLPL